MSDFATWREIQESLKKIDPATGGHLDEAAMVLIGQDYVPFDLLLVEFDSHDCLIAIPTEEIES